MADTTIVTEGLAKRYGAVTALRECNLSVGEGELFGLIGPDGAGKTTLFRILTSLIVPDEGRAQLCGLDTVRDFRQIRRLIGYMPGRFSLYQDLTVEENLRFFATLFHTTIEENYDLVKDIYAQIEPFRKRRAGRLSGGMKQKLALSCALIHKPRVLLLDEPTTGVDPVSRRELWEMLRRLVAQGITVFVSTPYMDEAAMCHRLGFLKEGQLRRVETPENLTRTFGEPLWAVRAASSYKALQSLRGHSEVKTCYAFGDSLHLTLHKPSDVSKVAAWIDGQEARSVEVEEIEPTIEDCYMKI